VAGAVWVAALHHAVGDRSLQEIVQWLEFLPGLVEALAAAPEIAAQAALREGMPWVLTNLILRY
jgi:hypothetical protein